MNQSLEIAGLARQVGPEAVSDKRATDTIGQRDPIPDLERVHPPEKTGRGHGHDVSQPLAMPPLAVQSEAADWQSPFRAGSAGEVSHTLGVSAVLVVGGCSESGPRDELRMALRARHDG